MKIFTCKDRLEDIMTCIYDAWSEALLIGHDQIQLKKEPVFQQTIFDEYIHVDQDLSKAEKVIRSIRRDISDEAYLNIYLVTLSVEEDALQAIYNFLRDRIQNWRECTTAICESTCDADIRIAVVKCLTKDIISESSHDLND